MKRIALVSLAGLLAGATGLAAATTPAGAAPRSDVDRPGVHHRTGADTRSTQDAVREFWTPARMRAAKPRGPAQPLAKPPGAGGGPKDGPKGPQGGSDLSLGAEWTVGRVTVGKVFFEMGGALYVCSGNAVDDVHDGRVTPDLVVTAGHCVNDGGNAWATNLMFIPEYDSTQPRTSGQPHGTFVAESVHTTDQWAAQGSDRFDYDVGIAKVGPNAGGETLAAAVGTSDIAFVAGDPGSTTGIDYSIDVHSFGYPQAKPYDGTRLISCWGTTGTDTKGGSSDYRLPCNMTGGSSGGPWLLDATAVDPADPIDNSDVSDTQVSVNSFGYRGEKNAMYGPVFGSTVEALYAAVS